MEKSCEVSLLTLFRWRYDDDVTEVSKWRHNWIYWSSISS